jgi:hypothetical protein
MLTSTLTFSHAKTFPEQIASNVTATGPRFWDIAAQGLVVMVAPLIIAVLTGRYIIRGLALGAVKHCQAKNCTVSAKWRLLQQRIRAAVLPNLRVFAASGRVALLSSRHLGPLRRG